MLTAPCTTFTARVIDTLREKGYRPQITEEAYRGGVSVSFSGHGEHSSYGVVVVGHRTGKIVRASISARGTTFRYSGATAVAAAVRALPETYRD